MPNITVHHLNNSKSQRVLWLLEELGLDYEIKYYKRDPGFAPPEMKLIHPLGKAPIVEIDGVVMAESGAIVEFLVDRHGGGKLMPDRASPQYGHYLEMMHYPEGSASMPVDDGSPVPPLTTAILGFIFSAPSCACRRNPPARFRRTGAATRGARRSAPG